jgi:hypothetical protein
MKNPIRLLITVILMLVAIAGISAAACYIHDQTTAVGIIPADVRSASYTTNDINVRAYHGQGKLVLDAEAQGSGITNIVKVQQSALASGATTTYAGDTSLGLNTTAGGLTKLGAGWTQSGIRQIKYIDLKLKKTGTIASDKVLTLTINSDESSAPSVTVLTTAATVLANTISSANYQTVRFTLTTPYELSNSTIYWLTLTSNYSASDVNYINWYVATVSAGGTGATYTPSTWTAVTTQAPLFTLYQYAFADLVTFSTVGNTASLQSKAIDLDYAGVAVRGVSTVAGGSSTGAYSLTLIAPTANQ